MRMIFHHKESGKDKWRHLLKCKINTKNQALNIQVISDVMTWHLLWHAFETGTLKDILHMTGITVSPGKKDSHFDECVSHSEACRQARSQTRAFRNNSCFKNYKWNIWTAVWLIKTDWLNYKMFAGGRILNEQLFSTAFLGWPFLSQNASSQYPVQDMLQND